MRTVLLINQHTKCIATLEGIQRCNTYIRTCQRNLETHAKKHWIDQFPGVVPYNEKQIAKYTRIKARLILYYSNQFMKMVAPVAEVIEQTDIY